MANDGTCTTADELADQVCSDIWSDLEKMYGDRASVTEPYLLIVRADVLANPDNYRD